MISAFSAAGTACYVAIGKRSGVLAVVSKTVLTSEVKVKGKAATNGKIVFHHCTSPEAADAIAKSGIIKKSVRKQGQNTDCNYGEGVYGTPLDPSVGRTALAQNNYAYSWEANEERGKVDWVIRIVMDDTKVTHKSVKGREIYIHDGDINLDEADEVDFIKVLGRGKLSIQKYK